MCCNVTFFSVGVRAFVIGLSHISSIFFYQFNTTEYMLFKFVISSTKCTRTRGEVNRFNDISVIYVTAHRCAGGLKKEVGPMVGLPTP